jgi:hypothetical protein
LIDEVAEVAGTELFDHLVGDALGDFVEKRLDQRSRRGTGDRRRHRRFPLALPPSECPLGVRHSIFHMGRRISGSYAYGAGIFRQRVNAMLRPMLALV